PPPRSAAGVVRGLPGLRAVLRPLPGGAARAPAPAAGAPRRRALRLPVHRLRILGGLAQGHGASARPRPRLIRDSPAARTAWPGGRRTGSPPIGRSAPRKTA